MCYYCVMSLIDKTQQKIKMRARFKACRQQLTIRAIQEKSDHIQRQLLALDKLKKAQTIFCYVSKKKELATHKLIKKLIALRKTIAVPLTIGRGQMKPALIDSFADLTLASFKTLQPKKIKLLKQPIDLNIMPALAISKKGDRLGWGGGYYDRFIAQYKPKFNLCLAFDCQLTDHLPVIEHDQKIDAVLTETQYIEF